LLSSEVATAFAGKMMVNSELESSVIGILVVAETARRVPHAITCVFDILSS
jgi:hypothetical protein